MILRFIRTSALTFDFEVYSAGQDRWLEVSSVSNFENYQANRLKCRWLEVSSVSNFENYQANRLKCRYRNSNKKTELCHTLNGSALALPRIMATLIENNQTEKGIVIPKVLVPYTGFDIID